MSSSSRSTTALHPDINQTAGSHGHPSMWETRCMHVAVCLLRAGQPNRVGVASTSVQSIGQFSWVTVDPVGQKWSYNRIDEASFEALTNWHLMQCRLFIVSFALVCFPSPADRIQDRGLRPQRRPWSRSDLPQPHLQSCPGGRRQNSSAVCCAGRPDCASNQDPSLWAL